jgi:quercetin dioxygenase-like cupin family protein
VNVLERLEERLPDTGQVQRIVLFDRQTGARHLSAVLVRLPPTREFAMHTHPRSEDCFFVLSGSGEALEPGGRFPISAPSGVWIPTGCPHGLRAGSEGMLEVGFQSPADHTAVPFEGSLDAGGSPTLVTSSFSSALPSGLVPGQWASAFPERTAWRHLDAEYSILEASHSLTIGFRDFECALVVAAGEIQLTRLVLRRLPAFSAIRLGPERSLALQATVSPTLLFLVKARTAV